jgi:hypothetical protein
MSTRISTLDCGRASIHPSAVSCSCKLRLKVALGCVAECRLRTGVSARLAGFSRRHAGREVRSHSRPAVGVRVCCMECSPSIPKASADPLVLLISIGIATTMAPATPAMRPDRLPVKFRASPWTRVAVSQTPDCGSNGHAAGRPAPTNRPPPGLACSGGKRSFRNCPRTRRIPSEKRRRRNSERVQAGHSRHLDIGWRRDFPLGGD